MDQSKPNYLTHSYKLDLRNSKIGILDETKFIKMNVLKKKMSENHLLTYKNDQLLSCNKEGFKYNNNALKVSEYTKEFKLSIYQNIKKIEEFEKINENYLNTNKDKIEYEIAKK